jgi:8-oxo-dGTP pyrophosphatase MutT (NUDIX family)
MNQESTVYQGILGEVVHSKQPDGRVFERYRRAPGVRLIVVTPDGKLVITREYRQETGDIDIRLPGGKVCDSLPEYHSLLASGEDLAKAAEVAAIKEGREELGLELSNLRLVAKAPAGATVEWDLYYFQTNTYTASSNGQQLEAGEQIEVAELTLSEVRQAIADGRMQEWRSVGVLLGVVLPKLKHASAA